MSFLTTASTTSAPHTLTNGAVLDKLSPTTYASLITSPDYTVGSKLYTYLNSPSALSLNSAGTLTYIPTATIPTGGVGTIGLNKGTLGVGTLDTLPGSSTTVLGNPYGNTSIGSMNLGGSGVFGLVLL